MKKYVLLLAMVICLGANTNTGAQSCREFQVIRHNINQVEMCISNFGQFGRDETGGNYGCWWPIGTNHNYICCAGIWFGTIDSLTGDTLVTTGYGHYWGQCEFVPGLNNMPINHPNAIIYMYPVNWPAPQDTFPMAPQDTVSHQDSWCCFNDCDSTYHSPGDTRPIGIEVYQTVYDWDISEVENMIFLTYDIKNVSGHNLQNCYIGVCADCDIGCEISGAANDRCTAIIERTYIINSDTIIIDDVAYQWQDEEELGWDSFPGVIGFDLLQTPFDLEWGADKDNDGIPDQYERDSSYYWNNLPPEMWDVDNDGIPDWRDASENPQLGMTAFKECHFPAPTNDSERYMLLAGYNFQTGVYEPYDTIIPPPKDQTFWMSSGPFDLEPDSTVKILFAVLFADWHEIYQFPDTALVPVDKWAQLYYDMYWFLSPGIKENTCIEKFNILLTVQPNPVFRCAKISFSLSESDIVSLRLYNAVGQLVRKIVHEQMPPGNHNINLNTKGLSQGTYFLLLETPDSKTSKSLVILH